MKHIVIIGGGAAGLVSAIYAKNETTKVTILERNSACGKKLLATGNGKCNYWNSDQSLEHYHSNDEIYLKDIITEENKQEILSLFSTLGVYPKIKNGYYYPYSNQATTIKNVLLYEIERKNINIKQDFLVEEIKKIDGIFELHSKNEIITADKVIIATGSYASPKTGSDGFGYKVLKSFGHSINKPLPALVQLKTTGNFLKQWAGIRTDVELSLYENNDLLKKENGEIQLTNYGISGICVFNLSRYVSIGLSQNKQETIEINFLPFIRENPKNYLVEFFKKTTIKPIKEQLEGFLNNKLVDVILTEAKIDKTKSFNDLNDSEQQNIVNFLTAFKVEILGTNSFEQAQVCTGGIPLTEINIKNMESKIIKDLYIVGELLDVDGDCGGYNLSFAWISGMLAGKGSISND